MSMTMTVMRVTSYVFILTQKGLFVHTVIRHSSYIIVIKVEQLLMPFKTANGYFPE